MFFGLTSICKHCHQETYFTIELNADTFELFSADEICCFKCGCKATDYDTAGLIHLVDLLEVVNQRNGIFRIKQINISE